MNFVIKLCSKHLYIPKNKLFNILILNRLDSTLSQSTVFIQDGLDVRELPWIVKKLCASEAYSLSPFKALSYMRNEASHCTDYDFMFERNLRACTKVHQVIKLLEIPDDLVTVHSAVFALKRISELAVQKPITMEDPDSFVSKAVLNELCDTVVGDIKSLNNENISDLISCCCFSYIYSEDFTDKIINEIESRIASSQFKITEVCRLISMLSQCVKPNGQLLKMLWIHLGSRYNEFDENDISLVYQAMEFLTPKFYYIFRLLDKQLARCWWNLQPSDVTKISVRLIMARYFSNTALQLFGKWLYTNVQSMSVDEMKQLLALYSHFQYYDSNLVTSLEKLVAARVSSVSTADKTLLMMTVDYLKQNRILSTSILNSVAGDFINSHQNYSIIEACSVLSGFGFFHYDPILLTSQLFKAVECWLDKNLNQIPIERLVQLFSSFIYIEKFPANYIKTVFNPHTIINIKNINDVHTRTRTLKNFLELQTSCIIEFPTKSYVNLFQKEDLDLPLSWIDGRAYRMHQDVKKILRNILKGVNFLELHIPNYTPHLINFEIPSKSMVLSNSIEKRFALIICMPEDHCMNNNNFVGQFMLKMRHLFLLGYHVVPIDYKIFAWKCNSDDKKLKYIQHILTNLNDKA